MDESRASIWCRAGSATRRVTQPDWLNYTVKPITLQCFLPAWKCVGYTTCLAGWQADRWCKDNAGSLERCTKALRAGQEIHLAETGAGRQGEPDRMGREKAGGSPHFSLHSHSWKTSHTIQLILEWSRSFSSVFLNAWVKYGISSFFIWYTTPSKNYGITTVLPIAVYKNINQTCYTSTFWH